MVDEPGIDLSGMYGDLDLIPRPPPKGYQQLAGLKLAGRHEFDVQVGSRLIRVANVEYVKLVEKQVRELRAELRDLQNYTKRLANAYNKLVEDVGAIDATIARKFDIGE